MAAAAVPSASSTVASVRNAISLAQLHDLAKGKQLAVLHFWASWCQPCQQMDAVLTQLAQEHPQAAFIRVEAEVVDEASIKYAISSVPTCIITQADTGAELSRVEGADPAALVAGLKAALQGQATPAAPAAQAVSAGTAAEGGLDSNVLGRIKWLLAQQPVMLFMKGSSDAPRCGFSSRVVKVLHELQAPFGYFDILSDEVIRVGLKQWSNWPTYPQLYVKGELVGGCDIVEEMKASGELQQLLVSKLGPNYASTSKPASSVAAPAAAAPAQSAPTSAGGGGSAAGEGSLHARLTQLVSQQPVMLFMKGSPDAPRCGFSRKVATALQEEGITFGHFDILQDEAVRAGLKEFSNWPTFPQLYVKGELLGGCDIVLQMKESGELGSTVQEIMHRG